MSLPDATKTGYYVAGPDRGPLPTLAHPDGTISLHHIRFHFAESAVGTDVYALRRNHAYTSLPSRCRF